MLSRLPGSTPTLLALVLALAVGGCTRSLDCGELEVAPVQRPASVVLVVADAMRRDVAGSYGGEAETPHLDGLAETGMLFERAYSAAPWTKPSIATLFTSLHPSQHRVSTHSTEKAAATGEGLKRTDVLAPGFDTLAEAYRAAGFQTAAFVANPWLLRPFGFDQGFDEYEDRFARWNTPGSLVSEAAAAWLEGLAPERPFFLYLHYIDPHRPYGPLQRKETQAQAKKLRDDPRPLPGDALRTLRDGSRYAFGGSALADGLPPTLALLEYSYAQGVERFDAALGTVLEALEKTHGGRSAAVVVTADHGESLYAHGIGNHGSALYEDEVAIPLWMRLPGVEAAGARNRCRVGLVDLMPFLCSYSGLACPEAMAGSRHLETGGPAEPRYVVVEGVRGAATHRALIGERLKLSWQPDHPELRGRSPYRLFDLDADSGEKTELFPSASDASSDEFRAMREALHDAVPAYDPPAAPSQPIDPDLRDHLEALGYGG